MKVLENRVPPPLVALLCALAMWGLACITPRMDADIVLQGIAAGLIALVGLGICVAGVLAFRRADTTVNPLQPQTASTLVTDGVYRITRNPMYLGLALMLLGWAVWLAAPLTLAGVVVFVLFIQRFQIIPEERAMARLFGEHFITYKSRVRRWI